MHEFVYASQAARVVFGRGALGKLEPEAALLGAVRALVLSTPGQRALAERAAGLLGARAAGIHDGAVMHVPAETVRAALDDVRRTEADCLVAAGGGSTIGLAKAVALQTGLPILAVPTTYSGSEMTPIHGVTQDGLKTTGKDPRALPRTVVYDPELSAGLPVALSVASGLNAIAHAAEGLYARDGNPVMALMAQDGIDAMARGLRRLVADASNLDARGDCLYGAWLSGMVLGSVGMALHHKLCHVLGGSFGLPHAQTHAVVLPHAMAYNAAAAPLAMERISEALGKSGEVAACALYDLARGLGAPMSLRELGMRAEDLERAADIAMANPYWNPRPIDRPGMRALLQSAFEGRRPD